MTDRAAATSGVLGVVGLGLGLIGAGAYSPPLRFTIHCGGELPATIRRVFLTLAVLWDGRSERLATLTVRGIRRNATLHLLPFERLLQWVQGALWAEAARSCSRRSAPTRRCAVKFEAPSPLSRLPWQLAPLSSGCVTRRLPQSSPSPGGTTA